MKPLTEMMQLIDTHSDVMPEGDYLRMCGLLKEVYDQMSKPSKEVARVARVARVQQYFSMSPPLNERYMMNNRMRYVNRTATKQAAMELRGLKLRSRITEAMKTEAGSHDRDVCIKYMRDKNFEVLRKRVALETQLVELESEKESLGELGRVIDHECDDERAVWRLNNPGADATRTLLY